MLHKLPFIAVLAGALTLSGCAALYPETEADDQHKDQYAQLLEKMKADRLAQAERPDFRSETPWLVAGERYEYVTYPELNDKPILLAEHQKPLTKIIKRLQEQTDVRFQMNSDLFVKPEDTQGLVGEGQGDLENSQSSSSSSMDILGSAFGGSGAKDQGNIFDDPTKVPISIEVDGNLTDALDRIVGQLSLSWKYDAKKNVVEFYRLERKNFQVFFPGNSSTEIGVGNSGDNVDRVISQSSNYQFDGGSWEEVSEAIKTMLSPWGKASIVKSTGNIIIKDTPQAIGAVEEYIREMNDIYGRQVYLEIKTASVKMSDANNFNMEWRNILNVINDGDFSVGLNSAAVGTSSIPNSLNVIRNANGAELALDLLATKSLSTEVNEQSVTTLSNQPASLKVLTETGYISNISQQAGSQTSDSTVSDVETDTVETGFNATLIPRVINKSTMQLQVAMELSGNLTLEEFDNTLVQTPTQDRNTVVQRAWLQSGQTWVIAAFKGKNSSEMEQGSGTSGFWALGGGTSREKSQRILLVMVTPHIQDGAYFE